ncbi:MAG: LuxR C-terminal-related transcriptional regulator [Tannerellaceae bacterium]|jgi:DNA-binding NarL/FixJ family response regulator|nr:LuxR C-terminal-related transcriptional regulator [Tannerellaceae bacterium]
MNRINKNRVGCIEPSPVVREGLKKLLEENAEFVVCSAFADLQAFRGKPGEKELDILLVNPAAISVYRQFAVRDLFPEFVDIPVVAIHYGYVDSDTLAGFDGALSIYDEGLKLRKKLRQFAQMFVRQEGATADSVDLSEREKTILIAVAKGRTNKEIAKEYNISVHTVVSHRKNISRKTGINTVAGLTVYAVFNNIVDQEDLL